MSSPVKFQNLNSKYNFWIILAKITFLLYKKYQIPGAFSSGSCIWYFAVSLLYTLLPPLSGHFHAGIPRCSKSLFKAF